MKSFRSFQVIALLYVLLLPFMMLVPKSFSSIPTELGGKNVFYMFPSVWQYVGYLGNWLCFFFLGYLAVIFITHEINNKTFRQNIITGLERKEFFFSKIIFIFIISLAATLYYSFVCMVYGFSHTEHVFFSKVIEHVDFVWRYFLMATSYMIMGLTIGLLVKRTGIALFLYLSYGIFIEVLFRYAVHAKIVTNEVMTQNYPTMHYYPMNAAEDLIPVPIPDMAENFIQENGFAFFLSPTEAILVSSFWIIVFMALSARVIVKSDL